MMKARDVMVRHVITVGPELDVKAVANTLARNGISAVPVIDINNRILGIISEGDLMRRIASGAVHARQWWFDFFSSADQQRVDLVRSYSDKAKNVMTHHVITVDAETSLQEIANLFEQHGIKRVPVVKNGQLVGIVSRANLVQALATHGLPVFDHIETDGALREAVTAMVHKLRSIGSMVDVIVDHGTVNLWGIVHTEEEKSAIRRAAESIPGARKVNDHLRVRHAATGLADSIGGVLEHGSI
jgi:CBS domain-containing protein